MTSIFTFSVVAVTERESGKFISREEIREAIEEALVDADPEAVEGGEDSVYSIVEWTVTYEEPVRRKKKATA